MKIDVHLSIAAPPPVVFRFYTMLDHLRYVCPERRHEWALERGAVVAVGREAEVRIQQGRHRIDVRFRTVQLDPDRSFEDEFVSWPVKGARHTVTLASTDDGRATELHNVITWDPPWYARPVVERHEREQRRFFALRQENAKRVIEAVYAIVGADAFRHGISEDCARAGIEPVVRDP
ncbi:hypothetical protein L6R52_13985 [Myxococcota bacterium]|nr:hypothetical protein [Myxococcota bacterium]